MEDWAADFIETKDYETLIDEIMQEYGTEILKLVYTYVRNQQTAEDLTQDIFVKCYRSLHTYNGKSKLRTWLWRIAINKCKDYLKSWDYKHVTPSNDQWKDSPSSEETEYAVIKKEEESELFFAVMNLPVNYREVIYLYYFEELSIDEIARITSCAAGTVKTRMRRAKQLLKAGLKEEL
ncbi:sigma-70 family RNA polymerase sigma factor [Metabacillus indicus]|uniref:RNA polymerase factor sigma C n=1 Tax=Metabacillus indicus TaxID=246786 RepID=A0A084GZS8_METID|nr:sigma-70 family RNA polymerase sigma factor [Metabacillus indicus]KEZ52840.1 RNA polymerase factor sigma C [Metabacillus indicus]